MNIPTKLKVANRTLDGVIDTVERSQLRIQDAFTELSLVKIIDGRLIQNIAIATSDTPVYHGLGHILNGWIVVRNPSAAYITEGDKSTDLSKYINIQASSAATISLWVF